MFLWEITIKCLVFTIDLKFIGEEQKENTYQVIDKPKEVVIMALLQEAIKDKCNPSAASEPLYEKPVAVFPNCERQEVGSAFLNNNLDLEKGHNMSMMIDGHKDTRKREDYSNLNSFELKKILLDQKIKFADVLTREQLIDLILEPK